MRSCRRTTPASVDIRDIARAAGVGVGTVYRRFGDKATLLASVIGADEQRLQDALLSGPPPIGPGAPPAERLTAFLDALMRLTEDNLNVLLAVDTASVGRVHVGAYRAWRLHVAYLLGELRPDLAEADRGWYADALLGPLDSGLYAFARRDQGLSVERRSPRTCARWPPRSPPVSAVTSGPVAASRGAVIASAAPGFACRHARYDCRCRSPADAMSASAGCNRPSDSRH